MSAESVNESLPPRGRYVLDLTDAEAAELRALVGPGTLRKKPRRRRREPEEYTATVERMLHTLADRAEGDVDLLAAVAQIRDLADRVLVDHVAMCREIGASWQEIGDRLAVTKQGAQQWYSRAVSAKAETPASALPGQEPLPGIAAE